MHRNFDAVDEVEDIEEDLPVQVRGWPSMLANDVIFELSSSSESLRSSRAKRNAPSSVDVVEGSKSYEFLVVRR